MTLTETETDNLIHEYMTEYRRKRQGRTVKRGWPHGPVAPPFIWGGVV